MLVLRIPRSPPCPREWERKRLHSASEPRCCPRRSGARHSPECWHSDGEAGPVWDLGTHLPRACLRGSPRFPSRSGRAHSPAGCATWEYSRQGTTSFVVAAAGAFARRRCHENWNGRLDLRGGVGGSRRSRQRAPRRLRFEPDQALRCAPRSRGLPHRTRRDVRRRDMHRPLRLRGRRVGVLRELRPSSDRSRRFRRKRYGRSWGMQRDHRGSHRRSSRLRTSTSRARLPRRCSRALPPMRDRLRGLLPLHGRRLGVGGILRRRRQCRRGALNRLAAACGTYPSTKPRSRSSISR